MKLLAQTLIILFFSAFVFAQSNKKPSPAQGKQKSQVKKKQTSQPKKKSIANAQNNAEIKKEVSTEINKEVKGEFMAFEAFLDVEGSVPTQVFEYPEDEVMLNDTFTIENWKTCIKIPDPHNPKKKICKNAVGWMPRDAKITVIRDKIVRPTIDPLSNEKIKEEYYRIEFSYCTVRKIIVKGKPECPEKKLKSGSGYVEAAILSRTKREEFYPSVRPAAVDPLDKKIKDMATAGRMNDVSIAGTADAIFDFVGDCTMQSAESISRLGSEVKNTFDHFILPKLKHKMNNLSASQKKKFSSLKDEKGAAVTISQIVDIEALARTMYAEMGRCYKRGLQYPMAVARIVANRSEATCALKNAVFIQGQHANDKSDLSKAATTPRQFNLWMKSEGKRKNGPLLQALCPPKSAKQKFYSGAYPEGQELALWQNSVRIATETVLYPDRFSKRTEELEARYYYTSGMKSFYDLERVIPKIEGRYLDNDQCMEIWRDIAKDRICNGGETPQFDKDHPPQVPLKTGVK